MLNSDADKKQFEAWLSTGLKEPVTADDTFAKRLLSRLEAQQNAELLCRVRRQQKICQALTIGLTLSGLGILFYPPVTTAIFGFLQTLLQDLIQLILEPTLAGIIIPAGVVIAAAAVLWNLIDMVSLE